MLSSAVVLVVTFLCVSAFDVQEDDLMERIRSKRQWGGGGYRPYYQQRYNPYQQSYRQPYHQPHPPYPHQHGRPPPYGRPYPYDRHPHPSGPVGQNFGGTNVGVLDKVSLNVRPTTVTPPGGAVAPPQPAGGGAKRPAWNWGQGLRNLFGIKHTDYPKIVGGGDVGNMKVYDLNLG